MKQQTEQMRERAAKLMNVNYFRLSLKERINMVGWWMMEGVLESIKAFAYVTVFCFNMGEKENKVEISGVTILLNELTLTSSS